MRRWIPLLVVTLAASSAGADGLYFSEGAGPARVKDELGDYYYRDSSIRLRWALGIRRGDWSLEGVVALTINSGDVGGDGPYAPTPTSNESQEDPDFLTVGLEIKRLFALSSHFDLYLRGGAGVGMTNGRLSGYNGQGIDAGGGIQLTGRRPITGLCERMSWNRCPIIAGAVFLDTGYEFYRLHDGGPSHAATAIDAQLSTFTLGFALGSDF